MEAPVGLEQGYELVELKVAAGPAVQQQKGYGICAAGGLMHKMQVNAWGGGVEGRGGRDGSGVGGVGMGDGGWHVGGWRVRGQNAGQFLG